MGERKKPHGRGADDNRYEDKVRHALDMCYKMKYGVYCFGPVEYPGLEDTVNAHAWELGMEVMEDPEVEILNDLFS